VFIRYLIYFIRYLINIFKKKKKLLLPMHLEQNLFETDTWTSDNEGSSNFTNKARQLYKISHKFYKTSYKRVIYIRYLICFHDILFFE